MPDRATAIRAEQLTKLYGKARGVLDLSFAVDAGEVFGFLGPNGAGKTTTIRLILDLIRPTRGRIEVFGATRATTQPSGGGSATCRETSASMNA